MTKAKQVELLQRALQHFLDGYGWRNHLHDEECSSPSGHEEHPDDRFCTCEGPHRISEVDEAMRVLGIKSADREGFSWENDLTEA